MNVLACRTFVALLFSLPLVGCFNDLSGVHINRDLGSSSFELARSDSGSGKDGSTATACEPPYLGVLIASNSGSGSVHGRVERVPLDGRGKCKALTLANTLPPDADAIAFVAPDRIAVGALSGVFQINFDDKAAAPVYKPSMFSWGTLVDDLFPLVDQSGKTLLAVAYDDSNLHDAGKTIESLVTLDGDQEISRWEVGSDKTIRIGFDPIAMAQSVLDPHNFFVVRGLTDQYAAGEFVPPWDNQPVEAKKPVYQLNLGSTGQTLTIKTLRQDRGGGDILRRTAWTFRSSSSSAYQVYMTSESNSTAKQLLGPYVCDLPNCLNDKYKEYPDAVPDFTDETAVISICTDASATSASTVRHVVRIRDNGSCEMLLDGTKLFSQEFPQRLTNVYLEP